MERDAIIYNMLRELWAKRYYVVRSHQRPVSECCCRLSGSVLCSDVNVRAEYSPTASAAPKYGPTQYI